MFVLGCHRSGTSLLTNVLKTALELHSSEEVKTRQKTTEWNIDNPAGHHESLTIVELNERLLAIANSSWNHPFLLTPIWTDLERYLSLNETRKKLMPWALKSHWIEKDPRLCLTREAYYHLLLKEVPSIAIIRHPYEVANSLLARDGMHSDRALALWMAYNYHLFNSCRSLPKDVLTFTFLRKNHKESSSRLCNAMKSITHIPEHTIEQQLKDKLVKDLVRSKPEQLLSTHASIGLREACITLYEICQKETDQNMACQLIAKEFKAHYLMHLEELNEIFPINKIPEANCTDAERLRLDNHRLIEIMHYSRTSYRRTAIKLARSAMNLIKKPPKSSP